MMPGSRPVLAHFVVPFVTSVLGTIAKFLRLDDSWRGVSTWPIAECGTFVLWIALHSMDEVKCRLHHRIRGANQRQPGAGGFCAQDAGEQGKSYILATYAHTAILGPAP